MCIFLYGAAMFYNAAKKEFFEIVKQMQVNHNNNRNSNNCNRNINRKNNRSFLIF